MYYWILRGYKGREEAGDTEEGLAFILEATQCVVIGRNYVYYWILRGYKGREEAGDMEEGLAFILEATKCVVIGRNYVYYWILRGYKQGCGSVFIFSGSGSSILGWTPIRIQIRIQSGSRALMTKI